MSHLSLEVIARLVDEAPTPAEAAHLTACAVCRDELAAMRGAVSELALLPLLEPGPRAWSGLASRLTGEGLIRHRRFATGPVLMKLAAAVTLFLAGTFTGLAVRDAGPAAPAGIIAAPGAAYGGFDAEDVVRAAEAAYLEALAWYAETTAPGAYIDPSARLAALEGIVLTTAAALRQAPADPVINGYHLAALAQREATLRQYDRAAVDSWF
jgi:hypothetical protein